MKSFIVLIQMAHIEMEQLMELRPKEKAVLMKFAEMGNLEATHVRKDFGGAYLIMKGNDAAEVENLVMELPMYPYMTVEIQELLIEEM